MGAKERHLSRFTHFVPMEEFVAVYHAVNLALVFVRQEIVDCLKIFQSPHTIQEVSAQFGNVGVEKFEAVIQQLVDFRMLVEDENEEWQDFRRAQGMLDSLPIGILYLLLTDRCNLGCGYCFVEGGLPCDYVFADMTPTVARAGLDLFAKTIGDNAPNESDKSIIFYGGEPTLNWQTLVSAVEYIEHLKTIGKLADNVKVTINTNGVLIDRDRAQFFAQHNIKVSVSIDGPATIHNQNRPYRSGDGSFEDTLQGFQFLKQAGIQPSISCTITPANLPVLPEVLTWFMDELGVQGLGFNLLLDPARMEIENPEEHIRLASLALINCFEVAREKGIYEDRVMRKVHAFVKGKVYLNDCGGCGQQIVIAPNGDVGVCQGLLGEKTYFVQNTQGLDPIQHPYWKEWRRRSPFTMPECQDCIALGICGGGCPMKVYQRTGSIWNVDEDFCIHAKITLEWLIKDLLKKTLETQKPG